MMQKHRTFTECPRCGSINLEIETGTTGHQIVQCEDCGGTYNLHGAPVHKSRHADKWRDAVGNTIPFPEEDR